MSTMYFKKLSGEVIPVEIGERVELYPIARATLGESIGYEIKLFYEGELLPQDAMAIAGRVIDVLYVPLEYKVYLEYMDNTLSYSEDDTLLALDDRYRIHVMLDGVIAHRFFFFERDGVVFTPDTQDRFRVWFDSFAELVEYMLSPTEYTEYTEEVRSRLVETIVGEWVPKRVEFEKGKSD